MKITQGQIIDKTVEDYEQISPKLHEDNVWFDGDYSEMYVVQADVTKTEAFWAMRLYDFKECGVENSSEGVQKEWIKPVKFYEGKSPEGEEDWWFTENAEGRKFKTKGWIARI